MVVLKFEAGADVNANGVLDTNQNNIVDIEEILKISFICDGENPVNPGSTYIDLTGDITNAEVKAYGFNGGFEKKIAGVSL